MKPNLTLMLYFLYRIIKKDVIDLSEQNRIYLIFIYQMFLLKILRPFLIVYSTLIYFSLRGSIFKGFSDKIIKSAYFPFYIEPLISY